MLCSESELNLSDESKGIIELSRSKYEKIIGKSNLTADSLMLLTQDNYITNDGQTKIIRTGQSGHVLNNYILPPSKLIVGENSTNFKYVANYEPNSSISDYVNKLSPEDYNIFSWPYIQQIINALKNEIIVKIDNNIIKEVRRKFR